MKKILALTFFLAAAACTTIEQNNGAEVHQVKLEQITTNSTKADIFKLLGSPSTKSSYGQETWYYITSKMTKELVREDKIIKQSVLAISFNAGGDKVNNVEVYDTKDRRDFATSSRVTPTAGRQLTVIEQILGNLGKFNTEGGGGGAIGSHAPGGSGKPY